MAGAKLHKVVAALPGVLEANSLYLVRVGTGFTLYATNDSGTVIAYPLNESAAKSFRERFRVSTDCIASTNTSDFAYTVSGTSAAFSSVATGSDNAVGLLRAALGTTATGRASIGSPNLAVLRFGLGVATFDTILRLAALSTATDTYSIRAGFIDSITGESVDGAFFRYTHSVNGGRWQSVCRSNNVETAVDTGIAVVAGGALIDMKVVVNAAGTSAAFTIDGTVVATITTNIPVAAGRETGYGVMALRSVGTVAINCYDCDALDVQYDFTTTR